MTVFCGPSGSGKSSLAMDTIYAEGQRRYVESLSAYARQFLGQMQKPRVEHISGLSPAISIEQKTTSKSPRSTVGTVTEIYDYLRILFARLGQPHCPDCDIPIGTQTADEIIEKILTLPEGTKLYLMAPVERRGQEKYEALWDEIRRRGSAGCASTASRIAWTIRPRSTIAASTRSRSSSIAIERRAEAARGSPTRSKRPSTWARGDARRPRRRRPGRRPNGRSSASASTSPATSAAAASSRSLRIISRSTARSAGARPAKGWACSRGRTWRP